MCVMCHVWHTAAVLAVWKNQRRLHFLQKMKKWWKKQVRSKTKSPFLLWKKSKFPLPYFSIKIQWELIIYNSAIVVSIGFYQCTCLKCTTQYDSTQKNKFTHSLQWHDSFFFCFEIHFQLKSNAVAPRA